MSRYARHYPELPPVHSGGIQQGRDIVKDVDVSMVTTCYNCTWWDLDGKMRKCPYCDGPMKTKAETMQEMRGDVA